MLSQATLVGKVLLTSQKVSSSNITHSQDSQLSDSLFLKEYHPFTRQSAFQLLLHKGPSRLSRDTHGKPGGMKQAISRTPFWEGERH